MSAVRIKSDVETVMKATWIITLFASTSALSAPGEAAQGSSELAAPVRLEADGARIDSGKDIGYAGPLVRDHDGDGLPDLLVSSFRGNIRFFRNTGSRAKPVLVEKEPLQAEGEPIRIHNW
jgi:hypothetical protein